MMHIMNTRSRYVSRVRRERMAETRNRILDGLVDTLAKGVAELSIPAVARAAGVSVPTVYRHFATKSALVDALGPHIAGKLGFGTSDLPHSPQELVALVRDFYRRAGGLDKGLQVLAASELGRSLRQPALPYRLKMIEDALAPATRGLDEADRTRLRDVVVLLTSSAMMRACQDYLGLSGDEAADRVTWAVLALCRAAGTDAAPGPQEMDA
jgi:AcrR family transcriptional regulator